MVPHPALDVALEEKAPSREGLDPLVFGVPAALAIAFVVWGFVDAGSLDKASGKALTWVMDNMGWLFVLTSSGFVVFVIWLALSRFGRIPLGRDDEEPEFRTVSWVAMMFSAGMGIGLMFYGVSEPLFFFVDPPPGTGEAGNPEAAQNAMATTLFHWTLHPWAMYAVVGLAIAYGVYRKGRVQLISAAFEPLLGRRAHGLGGQVIDMLAIFATLFGSAASLGLGTLQISAGLDLVAGVGEIGNAVLVGIIAVLTAAFVVSAVSGVAKGIQWLSNTNMVLAISLAFFLFVVGPTIFILNMIPTAVGSYLGDLPMMSARTGAEGAETNDWLQSWTVFYWAWWISWTPFVGMFIARISRGRTIRQFVTGVLLVPSLVSLIWFAVFGGAAINLQQAGTDIFGAGAPGVAAVHHARAVPVGDAHRSGRDDPGRDLLRVRCRRRVDRDGHPLRTRHHRPATTNRGLLGRGHGSRGSGDAADRHRRAQRAEDDHDRGRAAVRRGDGGAGRLAGEGPAQRPADGASRLRRRGGRAGGDHRRHRARRRLRDLGRAGPGDRTSRPSA